VCVFLCVCERERGGERQTKRVCVCVRVCVKKETGNFRMKRNHEDAARDDALQHTATCCNMLQHAATRCNTL